MEAKQLEDESLVLRSSKGDILIPSEETSDMFTERPVSVMSNMSIDTGHVSGHVSRPGSRMDMDTRGDIVSHNNVSSDLSEITFKANSALNSVDNQSLLMSKEIFHNEGNVSSNTCVELNTVAKLSSHDDLLENEKKIEVNKQEKAFHETSKKEDVENVNEAADSDKKSKTAKLEEKVTI